MDDGGSYVPRVNQLDADELDQEILSIFKGGLQNAFKYFIRYIVLGSLYGWRSILWFGSLVIHY